MEWEDESLEILVVKEVCDVKFAKDGGLTALLLRLSKRNVYVHRHRQD